MQRIRVVALVVAGMAVALLTGCRVETHKNGDGKDVNIRTPFGAMQVKTDDASVLADIGLPVYPGAQQVKEDDNHRAADVNMSFGDFQMRVLAISFRTSDAPSKVEAFYRDGMKRFGDVITCRNNKPVGKPEQTTDGLTCDDKKGGHWKEVNDMGSQTLRLKAGSTQHQHVVEIDPNGEGASFGLVALELPSKMFMDGHDEPQ